jgi:hypothetical protein
MTRSKRVAHIDPGLLDNKKVAQAGKAALGLWTLGLSWCARKLSDGRISTQAAYCALKATKEEIAALEKAGLWERATDFNGWIVHDYVHWSPSKAEIEAAERPALAVVQPPAELFPSATARAAARASNDGADIIEMRTSGDYAAIGVQWFYHVEQRFMDMTSWRDPLEKIGRKPAEERAIVAANWQATPYIKSREKLFYPDHAVRYWDDFLRGPRNLTRPFEPARTKAVGLPSSRSELESVPTPKWLKEAQ